MARHSYHRTASSDAGNEDFELDSLALSLTHSPPGSPGYAAPTGYSRQSLNLEDTTELSHFPDAALDHNGGTLLLYFTTVFVSLGVFLFGYDQGVMSGIISGPQFNDYFSHPSRAEIGTMVAILELGALASSLATGKLGDVLGRRKSIQLGAFIFIIGGAVQTFTSQQMFVLIIGRVVSGLGVGILSTMVPIFQSEISPSHNRGRLACIEFTGNIIGYASSVWVDYFCSFFSGNISWRLPLLIQCIMGGILFAGSFHILESPRWLLSQCSQLGTSAVPQPGEREALDVLVRLYGNVTAAKREFLSIKSNILEELSARSSAPATYRYMWQRYRRRVLIAVSSQMFAQLNGINVISYYAPLVFEEAGWKGRDAILMTGINSIVYVLSTVPTWYLVDIWGRRRILISGAAVMAAALFLISFVMWLDKPGVTPGLVVGLVVIYNAFFGYSWGPVPWLYPPEILPLSVRSKGASLSTASNWLFNYLVGGTTPVLQELLAWRMYVIFASCCVVSGLAVYCYFPETKGVELEDMDVVFGEAEKLSSVRAASMELPLFDVDAEEGGVDEPERGEEMRSISPVSVTEHRKSRQGVRPSLEAVAHPLRQSRKFS